MDPAGRVDGPDARRHHLDLGLAHRAFDGMHLAVGVGHADIIEVEQGNLADAAAGQRFRRPGTDPADADHRDVAIGQALQPLATVQPADTAEALFIHLHHQPPLKPNRGLPRAL
ncbi:conserved hypothetical protein [Pseudomonas aeruginosa NCMG1179]|nr:conserved hypothetical protein [Pseudomonas aeruginosa NCMG1179]